MDLKSLKTFESLVSPTQTGTIKSGGGLQPQDKKGIESTGPSFKEALEKSLKQPGALNDSLKSGALTSATPANLNPAADVKFSNHALERMRTRGISFTPQDVTRLNEAVTKAAAKGSRDTLVLMNDSALIVSVKNKTVVTVMDKTALKENVFTNIDSTIVM